MTTAPSSIYVQAADAVVTNAALIALPCVAYALFCSGLAIAIAGAKRKQVMQGFGMVLALAFLGVVLGYFTGHSRSSTVQALLPALLTFISGMAAYLASRESMASWRAVLPYGLAAMLMAVVLAVSHGLALKSLSLNEERNYEQRQLKYKVDLEVLKQTRLAELKLPATPTPDAAASAASGVTR